MSYPDIEQIEKEIYEVWTVHVKRDFLERKLLYDVFDDGTFHFKTYMLKNNKIVNHREIIKMKA